MKKINIIFTRAIDYYNSQDFKEKVSFNKGLEIKRKDFVNHFNPRYFCNLDINEYITNGTKTTFCYRLEWELRELGSIKGSNASKYGVHSNKTGRIQSVKKWGADSSSSFQNIKKEILNLFDYIQKDDLYLINESRLPTTIKGKICYVYNPEKFIPIYSEKHIDFFLFTFCIPFSKDEDYITKNRKLLEFKEHTPPFSQYTNLEFMNFLYSDYGFKKETDELKHGIKYNYDKTKIKKGTFGKGIAQTDKNDFEKEIDFKAMYENKLKIGVAAEKFVLGYERKQFPNCAKKIRRVGCYPQKYHYDILSVFEDGREKHIEVKTKTDGGPDNVDFYLTHNEYKQMNSDSNYVIYFVYNLKNNPQIIEITPNKIEQLSKYYALYRYIGKFKEKKNN